jgi:hypothetical protein
MWRVRIFRGCLNLSEDLKQERHQGTGNDKLENHRELCEKKAATRSERTRNQGGVFQPGDQGDEESKPMLGRWLCYGWVAF